MIHRLTLVSLTALPAVLALLYFVRLPSLSVPALALMLTLLSWCIYNYFLPFHHLRRRALLAHVTAENSFLRRWLWSGFWSRLWLVLVSVVLALTLLMVANGLSDAEWLWLLLCVPVLVASLPFAMRLTGGEAEDRYHFPMALRVAVWISVALATIGLIVLHLGSDGVPDTRHLSITTVISQTWQTAVSQSSITLISWLIAVEAVSDALVWHLMQQAATLSTQPAWLKLLVWLVFLLFLSLRVAVLWFALAGILYWLAGPAMSGNYRADKSLRAFGLGMLILAVSAWLMSLPGMSGYMRALTDRVLNRPEPEQITVTADPCERQAPQEFALMRQQVEEHRASEQQRMQTAFLQASDVALNEVFALAEPLVEQYLDWNYSIAGQYQQLGVLTAAAFRAGVGSLPVAIEQAFASYLSEQIDRRLQPVLTPALINQGEYLESVAAQSARQFIAEHMAYTEQLAASAICLRFEMPSLSAIDIDQKSLVGLGAISGFVTARLAARGGIHAGSALVGRQAGKRMISATSARVASRTAQSAAVGTAGSLCGPAAAVCIPALFAASWLATDIALNELDEALNRDQLRRELLAALDEEKQRIKQQYQDSFLMFSSHVRQQLDDYHEQRFRIIDQGIAPGDSNLLNIKAE